MCGCYGSFATWRGGCPVCGWGFSMPTKENKIRALENVIEDAKKELEELKA